MSENFNIRDFANLAKQLLEKCENGEEFLLGNVYNQVRQAYEKFPEDTVIRQMSSVIEKMAEKHSPSTIINQKQLSSIYNDLVRLAGDTKFRMVLGNLLLPAPEMKRATASNLRNGEEKSIEIKDLIDNNAIGILRSAFDDDLAGKVFDNELANKGIEYVRAELKLIGFGSPRIKVAGGNKDGLFYSASFNTPRGEASVYIPVKIGGGKFNFPTTFIDDKGEIQLTKENLKLSIERRSNCDLDKSVDPFLRSAEINLPEIEIAKPEMPKELAHLAHDFEDSVLESVSSFGKDAVNMGKKVVATELRAIGFKNAQVRFGSDSNNAVVYLATINTPKGSSEIEVPIEMKCTMDEKYIPLMPTIFAYDEVVSAFTSDNLQKFALNPPTKNSTSGDSMYAFMLLPELKEEMIKAAGNNEYIVCEEILNHIGNSFGENDYKNAVADYQYLLSIKSKSSENQSRYAEISKQAGTLIPAGKGSIYPRQANGQPIKDMVKDENGRYRRISELEKEKLNPIDESGVLISTSKILFS